MIVIAIAAVMVKQTTCRTQENRGAASYFYHFVRIHASPERK